MRVKSGMEIHCSAKRGWKSVYKLYNVNTADMVLQGIAYRMYGFDQRDPRWLFLV